MSGWVRLHRRLSEHPLWTSERFTKAQAWVDLLMRANYHDSRVFRGTLWIAVSRGQVFTSQQALAARWRWNRKTVRSFLDALKADTMLDIQTSNETDTGYTLLSIRNFERFQGGDENEPDTRPDTGSDTRGDSQRTVSGQSLPTSKKNKKNKKEPAPPALCWNEFLSSFPEEAQRTLAEVHDAVATTRKSGTVAASILDALARQLARYPVEAVVSSSRTYLDKDYAGEGKDERYLLGIVRGTAKGFSQNGHVGSRRDGRGDFKTSGQRAIERAAMENE